MNAPNPAAPPLKLFSVIIPARDEEGALPATIEHLHLEFNLNQIPHEIVVVDDGSKDGTWEVLQQLKTKIPALRPIQNTGEHGFGRAITFGLRHCTGDAVVIMMADESDDARDAVRYWKLLNEGWDCVFGSRFVKGGGVIDYPKVKLFVNRLANFFIRCIFQIPLNDTTNAFKAYRRTVITGCEPLIAPHFNLTVELPLKAIVRGYSWTVVPITWRNRRYGGAFRGAYRLRRVFFSVVPKTSSRKLFRAGNSRNSGVLSKPNPMPRAGTRPTGIWAKIAFVGPLPSAGGDFERASSVFDQSSGATPERARGTRALPVPGSPLVVQSVQNKLNKLTILNGMMVFTRTFLVLRMTIYSFNVDVNF